MLTVIVAKGELLQNSPVIKKYTHTKYMRSLAKTLTTSALSEEECSQMFIPRVIVHPYQVFWNSNAQILS